MARLRRGVGAGAAAVVLALGIGAPAGIAHADRGADRSSATAAEDTGRPSHTVAAAPGRTRAATASAGAREAAPTSAAARTGSHPSRRIVRVPSAPSDAVPVAARQPRVPVAAAAWAPAAASVPDPVVVDQSRSARVASVAVRPPAAPSAAAVSSVVAPSFHQVIGRAIGAVTHLLDAATGWLSALPGGPLTDLLSGALLLIRRSLVGAGLAVPSTITFAELDSTSSPIGVRVDPRQVNADAIKVDAGTTFTLTLPGPASDYTVLANKPALVDIVLSGNQIQITATTPGFLGLAITSQDGTAQRYAGLYIADAVTHIVPDSVAGYLPVGSVSVADAAGDAFLESFNFREDVAPIDYLYIYDQGGADYTDGNLTGLLTQAARHGLVPVVVFYNIQNVLTAAGKSTGVVEGWDAAYQAINDYNVTGQADPTLFTGYMGRYFGKLGTDFAAMNRLGIPVQVVMEPDFLGYMAARTPSFQQQTFVPTPADRTLNTANVSAMYDAGLLTRGADPAFPDTVAGLVQAVNYYVGSRTPNLRIGWKTNIWSVADQQVWTLGLLHVTDPVTYPWQGQWTKPAPTWNDGRAFIATQAAGLGAFLAKVGVTSWSGAAERAPFVAIDKYGVDGAYTFDPNLFDDSQTAALSDLTVFVGGAYQNFANLTEADSTKYFGLSRAEFAAFYTKYNGDYRSAAPDIRAVFGTLQNAVIADPNLAKWFFNADQWSNYLYFIEGLSGALGGTKVMLWQIPQGHINGSTTLTGRDLSNTAGNFEDSATSYFFGDSFTAAGGRLTHFRANQAEDPSLTVDGNTVTWGEHMTLAGQSGAMSVLFGAGLGISTRGSPTPGGDVNDRNFWYDKAAGYLAGVA